MTVDAHATLSGVVDTRGAVLLDALVPAVEVAADPDVLSADPAELFHAPLRLMFAASVLQALAIHVAQERGRRFGVDSRDLTALTVGQLAALIRDHNGSAGQSFELAVADAMNADVPGVIDPIRQALHDIGVPMADPRAVVMGLEKTADPDALAHAVAAAIADRTLRTGRRGRPARAATAVSRLLASGTAIRTERGALALSDLLIYDAAGSAVVTGSVKITPGGFAIPDDPPRLWITTGTPTRLLAQLPPWCTAIGIGGPVLVEFTRAHREVVDSLHAVDVRRAVVTGVIGRLLRDRRRDSVAQACMELLERADAQARGSGRDVGDAPTISGRGLEVTTAELPDYEEYTRTETGTGLTVMTRRPLDVITTHHQFFTRTRAA